MHDPQPHLLKYKDDLPFYMDSKPTLVVAKVGVQVFQGIDFRNQTQNLLSKLGNTISIGCGSVCVRGPWKTAITFVYNVVTIYECDYAEASIAKRGRRFRCVAGD